MDNIKISKVCGLCAGCLRAINTVKKELASGNNVTIFKEIVHNKNVNNSLTAIGAVLENDLDKINPTNVVIVRAHGEPPQTFEHFKNNNISFRDCTCPNVENIHVLVNEFSSKGYNIILLGKHKQKLHPEVEGTAGWCQTRCVLVEDEEDLNQLENVKNQKFYLVCQTTFNIAVADLLISKIKQLAKLNNFELVVNKSICSAQKLINQYSLELAKQSDVMIVVGGKNSSNSKELYNNMSSVCPSVFVEDVNNYKKELELKGIKITPNTKVGLTAGASTQKEELTVLKQLIEKDLKNI